MYSKIDMFNKMTELLRRTYEPDARKSLEKAHLLLPVTLRKSLLEVLLY